MELAADGWAEMATWRREVKRGEAISVAAQHPDAASTGGAGHASVGNAARPLLRLAQSQQDLQGAQRLRYRVFVEEMGASGDLVDHEARLERDALDAHFDHLVLIDPGRDPETLEHVIGAYRLLPGERAAALGRFYCDAEYDLSPLLASGRKLVELGRSCVDPAYRKGPAMMLLWNGLADYVVARGIEIMFGVASFPGADPASHAPALSWLHHHHLAPPDLRVRVRPEQGARMDLLPSGALDRKTALAAMPPLIRGYLRLGGMVGEGAWIDQAFNTTDVCLIVDTAAMSGRHESYYRRKAAGSGPNG